MKNRDRCLVHWSPTENYSRSWSLEQEVGNGTVYCQAVVQVLFADSNKEWTLGQIGELVLYKSAPKRLVDSADLFLSFFAKGFYLPPLQLSERFFRAIRLFRRPASNKTEQINFGSQQYVANSKIVNTRSTNFANKKKQIKIESQTEELDPVLQPRDFLKQVTDCALSDDI